jgi:hypothetical protein
MAMLTVFAGVFVLFSPTATSLAVAAAGTC